MSAVICWRYTLPSVYPVDSYLVYSASIALIICLSMSLIRLCWAGCRECVGCCFYIITGSKCGLLPRSMLVVTRTFCPVSFLYLKSLLDALKARVSNGNWSACKVIRRPSYLTIAVMVDISRLYCSAIVGSIQLP